MSLFHILKSYFQQPYRLFIMLMLTGYTVGAPQVSESPEKALFLFLLLPVCWYAAAGLHLRQMTLWPLAYLTPHYFRKQLIAAGILAVLSGGFPVIAMMVAGHDAVITFGWIFLVFTLFFVGGYRYGRLALAFSPIVLVGFIFFRLWNQDWSLEPDGSPGLSHALLIGVGLILIFWFVRNYLNDCGRSLKREDDRMTVAFGKSGLALIRGFAQWRLGQLLARPSKIRFVSLARYSLFTPGFLTYGVGAAILCFAAAILLFLEWREQVITSPDQPLLQYVSGLLMFGHLMMIIFLSTNFLQHRGRLPALWLQAPTISRRSFYNTIALAYLSVVMRHFLLLSFGLAMVGLVMSMKPMVILVTTVLGALIQLCLFGLSLICGRWVQTRSASTWSMSWGFLLGGGGIFLGSVIDRIPEHLLSVNVWLHLPITATLAAILVFAGMQLWQTTAMETNMRDDGLEEPCA